MPNVPHNGSSASQNNGKSWLFCALGLENLEPDSREILKDIIPLTVQKGGTLFHPGDTPIGFVVLLSGRVDVHLLGPSGRELLLYSIVPGETCLQTTMCLLGEQDYAGEASAGTQLTVAIIPVKKFHILMASSPVFRDFVFHAFAKRMRNVTSVLEQVAFVRVETRLASALIQLANDDGVIAQTHQSLATHIGSSREVISRRLDVLKAQNIVELTRGEVKILDRDKLRVLAAITK